MSPVLVPFIVALVHATPAKCKLTIARIVSECDRMIGCPPKLVRNRVTACAT